MATSTTDRIEKSILLRAPRARVWRALTDQVEFGRWFGANLPPGTLRPGTEVKGPITSRGYEHITLVLTIDRMEAERLVSWRWQPGSDPATKGPGQPTTLVTFTLEDAPGGTLLKLVESGFDALPAASRAAAFRDNDGGWSSQMKNVERHVSQGA